MEGTVVVTQTWLKEWPVSLPRRMFTHRIEGGFLTAEALSDGSIDIQISGNAGESCAVTSIPVRLKSKRLTFGISWKLPDDLVAFVNGVQIASLKPAELPREVELPAPVARTPKDFSAANEAARKKRNQEEAARVARPGCRMRTLKEEIDFLHSTTLQLQELVEALDKGLDYHLYGALAMIRSSIARGGRNFQPLLQRVAGRLDKPLLLYVPMYERDTIDNSEIAPTVDYRFDVLPEPEIGDEAIIDLDVWLATPGITKSSDKVVSQNDVIRLFSDAAGSHFDPDTPPDYDSIEAITVYRQGEPVSVMVAYCAQIARCICHLNERLILAARQ